MTRSFQVDFTDRKRQVRHYLAVVSSAERSAQLGQSRVDEGRLLTLRAGTFLILYNLIEATTRGSIEAIHDQIIGAGVPFSRLSIGLRKEVLRLFKKGADPLLHHTMNDFPAEFVAVALAQKIKVSGTVDAKAIRQFADCYGFSSLTKRELTRNGSDLLTIKSNRNDLAHGLKTFEEVGRDYTSTDLMLLSRRTFFYMDGIIKNISAFLDSESYLS